MTHSTQTKVLAIIDSCYTPAHIEAAARMLSGIDAPAVIKDALQMRRVEIAASVAVQVADKVLDAETRLQEAQYCLTAAQQSRSAHSIETWKVAVIKCRKEVAYWNEYFETTEA